MRFPFIILFLCLSFCCDAKTITLLSNRDLQSQLYSENAVYELSSAVNLEGRKIILPLNSVLKFIANGRLIHGTIYGNNSKIIARKRLVLDDIVVEGTWNNEVVYSQWVNLYENSQSNNTAFKNLFKLCEGDTLTHFYLQKGIFCVSAINRSAPIIVPSNVYWHNLATIKMLPNDLEWYNIVYINKSSNVTIDGGIFEGDMMSHYGVNGEWGHGIKCSGASNVSLKNLICKNCWGDGIDLIEGLDVNNKPTINCRNIIIDNVKCIYNRRQGMSIEAASDVKVINSEFAYTGYKKHTPPSAGIDIEPWISNCKKVWNILFDNCKMYSNMGYDILIYGEHLMANDELKINFFIKRCKTNTMLVNQVCGISINNSVIFKELKVVKTKNMLISDTQINKISKGIGVSNFSYKK